jgi:hypothetical protein
MLHRLFEGDDDRCDQLDAFSLVEVRARPADDAWRCRCPVCALIACCPGCGNQVEPDPAETAARYGAATPVLDWRERLVLFLARQPASRYGGASEMRPQPVTAAAPVPREWALHQRAFRAPVGAGVVGGRLAAWGVMGTLASRGRQNTPTNFWHILGRPTYF